MATMFICSSRYANSRLCRTCCGSEGRLVRLGSRYVPEPPRAFGWQTGYGAFTVSHSKRLEVKRYIARQREHHKKMTYPDEFRKLLKKHEIVFKEEYLL